MTAIDPRRYLLSEAESQRIFLEEIVPAELDHGVPQDKPVVVFVAGQPGAGKTTTTDFVKEQLDRRGGAIVVNSDFYKPYHPEYSRLLAEDDRNAAPYTSLDGRRWMAAAERYLIARRVDTIIETTMRDPGDFLEPAAMFRQAGYRVEAAIMAVPEALSRLGIVHRYHDQVQKLGHGRLTARDNHDASYHGVLHAARAIDVDRIVDVAAVYRRGNHQLHINYLDGAGNWRWPAATALAIERERTRQWTAQETRAFADTVARLANEMGAEWHAELADITARAVPLADPQIPLPTLGAQRSTGVTTAAKAFPTRPRVVPSPAPSTSSPPEQQRPGLGRGNAPSR